MTAHLGLIVNLTLSNKTLKTTTICDTRELKSTSSHRTEAKNGVSGSKAELLLIEGGSINQFEVFSMEEVKHPLTGNTALYYTQAHTQNPKKHKKLKG